VRAHFLAGDLPSTTLFVGLYLRHYGQDDQLQILFGPGQIMVPGQALQLDWPLEGPGIDPIAEVGLILHSPIPLSGTLYLDYLTWDGEPHLNWQQPQPKRNMWRRAWVDAIDHCYTDFGPLLRLAQNQGRGLLIQGTRQWRDIKITAGFTPFLAQKFGLALRVQGLRRYYALLLDQNGRLELVRVTNQQTLLAATAIEWDGRQPLTLSLEIAGQELHGYVGNHQQLTAVDPHSPLNCGAAALLIEEGTISVDTVQVQPSC
jgi:hypothetical protein